MLKEVTFRVDPSPVAERIVEELQVYSRWAESVESFGTGAWRAKTA